MFALVIFTLLLFITPSRNFLGCEEPSHSDDRPTLGEGCGVSNSCGQRAGFLGTDVEGENQKKSTPIRQQVPLHELNRA